MTELLHTYCDTDFVLIFFSDYTLYFKDLPINSLGNQTLFWSGTFDMVAQISKNKMGVIVVSSANADASLIINNIQKQTDTTPYWCGKKGGKLSCDDKN